MSQRSPQGAAAIGTLYVIGTPIGNLEDLSLRARRILSEVSLVLAEDTRITRRLFARYDLHPPLRSYHAHSSASQQAAALRAIDEGPIALVSDAGTPSVSDPGVALVQAALAAGHAVVPVPGPCAISTALSVAGLPADAYAFLGFLPRRAAERRAALARWHADPLTLVLFEAPHRLRKTLQDLEAVLGDRPITVCRELTKLHEEIWRGTLAEATAEWMEREPRGEFALVIGGAVPTVEAWDDERVRTALEELRACGAGARDAARAVASLAGRPSRDVYRLGERRA